MPTRQRILSSILATAVLALPSALFAIDTDGDGLDDSVETNTATYVSPANTGPNQITITEVPGGPGIDLVTVALPTSLTGSGRLFIRLNVVVAAP